MSGMNLEIRTPYGSFYEGECDRFTVTTASGVITVLPHHLPLVAPINIGKLTLVIHGAAKKAAIAGGFLYITPHKTIIVSGAVEFADEIDVHRAQLALDRARQLKEMQKDQETILQAERAIQRALARLEVADSSKLE